MNDHSRADHSPSAESSLIDRLAGRIVERGMSAPAILFLESTKPLNMVGCQALNFLEPIVQSLFSIRQYDDFVRLMEKRSNIEDLILRIEKLEEEKKTAP